jgi:hypothetical protein
VRPRLPSVSGFQASVTRGGLTHILGSPWVKATGVKMSIKVVARYLSWPVLESPRPGHVPRTRTTPPAMMAGGVVRVRLGQFQLQL